MLILSAKQLIDLIKADLPIKAFPNKELLPAFLGKYPGISISTSTEIEIRSLFDNGETGGVTCEILPIGFDSKKAEQVLLCSITYLNIKKGEPHYAEITKYQIKRVKKLMRQNRFF